MQQLSQAFLTARLTISQRRYSSSKASGVTDARESLVPLQMAQVHGIRHQSASETMQSVPHPVFRGSGCSSPAPRSSALHVQAGRVYVLYSMKTHLPAHTAVTHSLDDASSLFYNGCAVESLTSSVWELRCNFKFPGGERGDGGHVKRQVKVKPQSRFTGFTAGSSRMQAELYSTTENRTYETAHVLCFAQHDLAFKHKDRLLTRSACPSLYGRCCEVHDEGLLRLCGSSVGC